MAFQNLFKVPEKIRAAAVRVDTQMFWGDNHGECIRKLKDATIQGFMTTLGRFVDRKEALKIARANGQIKHKHAPKDILLSEDLKDLPKEKETENDPEKD